MSARVIAGSARCCSPHARFRCEDSERETSQALVYEAVKLAPDLVPAVALAARYLAEAGDLRKATRMIERTWEVTPHPDLAETYAYLRFGDSARDRLTRVRRLAALAPNHVESALALARAAIDAREFGEARNALSPFLAQPSQRVALLMADLEQAEFADEGRSREWTARAVHAARDPAWTADGFVSEQWMPMSPVSGRIDAFEWKAPVAAIGVRAGRAEAADRAGTGATGDRGQARRSRLRRRSGSVAARHSVGVRPVPPVAPRAVTKRARCAGIGGADRACAGRSRAPIRTRNASRCRIDLRPRRAGSGCSFSDRVRLRLEKWGSGGYQERLTASQ